MCFCIFFSLPAYFGLKWDQFNCGLWGAPGAIEALGKKGLCGVDFVLVYHLGLYFGPDLGFGWDLIWVSICIFIYLPSCFSSLFLLFSSSLFFFSLFIIFFIIYILIKYFLPLLFSSIINSIDIFLSEVPLLFS